MELNPEILINIGLSKGEAMVYLALLKLGKTKSGKIIKLTGLQSSVIHNSLNTLTNKGFVTYILEGKIKHYSALNPKLLEEDINTKKQDFRKDLPELEALYKSSKIKPTTAEVYEGFKGLQNATLNMIKDSKKGDIYKYFAAEKILLDKNALDFFSKIDLIKKSKNISVRGIAQTKEKELLKTYKNSTIRYISEEIPPAMNIFRDKILIMSLSGKPMGILLQSKEISKQYHELWDSLWKKARK